jgi:hypothetical protein
METSRTPCISKEETMGSIVSLFTGPSPAPEPEVPQVAVAAPAEEQELGSDDNRRKRAEERRRALAQAAGGAASTVRTTPLGSTARPEVATAGLTAADSVASTAAQPRKSTLG